MPSSDVVEGLSSVCYDSFGGTEQFASLGLKDTDEGWKSTERSLRKVFNQGENLTVFELSEEIPGLICAFFDGLDDVVGYFEYVTEILIELE